jgi:cation diffusion facilitator CzcD-associated flavoprotein CzcO
MDQPRVVIIGGGLAGMVVAHELAKKKCQWYYLKQAQDWEAKLARSRAAKTQM